MLHKATYIASYNYTFYLSLQPDTGKRVMSVLSVDYPSYPLIPGVDRAQVCVTCMYAVIIIIENILWLNNFCGLYFL